MIFTDTVTVYNHYKDPDGVDKWKRTILKGVMWKRKIEKTVSSDGRFSIAEYISITIPYRSGYLEHTLWQESKDGWTLNTSSGLDIIVLSECDKELDGKYRLKDLKRDIGQIGTVKAVFDNTNRDYLKHWRVIAI